MQKWIVPEYYGNPHIDEILVFCAIRGAHTHDSLEDPPQLRQFELQLQILVRWLDRDAQVVDDQVCGWQSPWHEQSNGLRAIVDNDRSSISAHRCNKTWHRIDIYNLKYQCVFKAWRIGVIRDLLHVVASNLKLHHTPAGKTSLPAPVPSKIQNLLQCGIVWAISNMSF